MVGAVWSCFKYQLKGGSFHLDETLGLFCSSEVLIQVLLLSECVTYLVPKHKQSFDIASRLPKRSGIAAGLGLGPL